MPRSAPRPPAPTPGFLNTLPKVRFVVGWVAFRWASSSATSALISSTARGTSRKRTCATTSPGASAGVPVGEPEPGEVDRPRARSARRRRASSSTALQSRPYAPAFMRTPPPAVPGDRGGELEPAEPRVARAVEADRVRRAAAGDQRLALDPRLGELALEPQDERVDAVVGDEQVRAEPDRLDRDALRRRPSRAAPRAGRASRAARASAPGRRCRSW